jgi:hypothetical protein
LKKWDSVINSKTWTVANFKNLCPATVKSRSIEQIPERFLRINWIHLI